MHRVTTWRRVYEHQLIGWRRWVRPDRFITSVMTRTAHGLDNLCTCTNNIHADMTRQSAQSIHATMTVTKQHLFAELVDTWLQSLEKSTQFPVLGWTWYLPKTRMMRLPYGEEIMIVGRTMWTQSTSVTDGQTDGQTRQTELRQLRLRKALHRAVKILQNYYTTQEPVNTSAVRSSLSQKV